MGATFPAIITGAALDSATRRTARTGYLYSINTLGAALGCFAAGYHLLFEFGVQTTITLAFILYALAACCALVAGWANRDLTAWTRGGLPTRCCPPQRRACVASWA
jgi:hypothetical protein